MTETMVIRHVIVKKEDLVDVFPEKAPGNTRPAGTGWVKRIQKWNIGPTKISVKLDVYRFIFRSNSMQSIFYFYKIIYIEQLDNLNEDNEGFIV